MKMINRLLWCVSMLLLSLNVFSQKVEGNDRYVNKVLKVDDFNTVKINGAFNVIYHHSTDSAGLIKLYGEENILDAMAPESKSGVLNIKFANTSKKDFGVVVVDIYSTDLRKVENDAGAVFETAGKINGSEIELLLMGNGQIRANDIDFGVVKAKILAGNGDIFLKGTCRTAELIITGTGEIKAHELVARDVKCRITGNATIGCYAEQKLNSLITGAGTVYYKGNPEIKKNTIGAGKVKPLPEDVEIK